MRYNSGLKSWLYFTYACKDVLGMGEHGWGRSWGEEASAPLGQEGRCGPHLCRHSRPWTMSVSTRNSAEIDLFNTYGHAPEAWIGEISPISPFVPVSHSTLLNGLSILSVFLRILVTCSQLGEQTVTRSWKQLWGPSTTTCSMGAIYPIRYPTLEPEGCPVSS